MSGAMLLALLKKSGTGENKLDIGRRALLNAKAEGRVADADEVIGALVSGFPVDGMDGLGEFHATVEKAREIVETGKFEPKPRVAQVKPEEEMLTAKEKAALKAMVKAEEEAKAKEEAKTKTDKEPEGEESEGK